MSKPPHTPPEYEATAFNCPYCHAYSQQVWSETCGELMPRFGRGRSIPLPCHVEASICLHCEKPCLWINEKLTIPNVSGMQPPNSDLSEDIQQLYIEASDIFNQSPRAAAALLRAALEKMLRGQLKGKGKNIYNMIQYFIEQGQLSSELAEYIHIIRDIGNDAVHAQTIVLNEKREDAAALFPFINYIAQEMLTKPRERKDELGKLQSMIETAKSSNNKSTTNNSE